MNPSTTHSAWSSEVKNADVNVTAVASTNTSPSGDEPTVVIIFGWLGAKMATLRKYADTYQRLFPSSAQVIVAADTLRYWKPASAREQAVLPALKRLQELNVLSDSNTPGDPPRILLHVMSNGGLMSSVDLATAIRKRNLRAPPGAKCALILDSTPAPPTLVLAIRAFTAGTRSLVKKALLSLTLSVVYFLTWMFRTLTRRPEAIAQGMAALNQPDFLPFTSLRTPRLYLYSSGDTIVPAEAVEEHAARARMAGFPVQMVNFGKSGHVSHARDYPEKYWEGVRTFWVEAMKN
ncbi:DUF829-domain-containing protein [Polyporus arcularius HHB13444]|uniref:DUF829-domain-containing protein n=1 Tax=Polyporus arcularius HHB13444 TaxID=1314778 RepID=A0A5C3PGP7_9APHY|nr:DUF829-domain-containing protein [Polyporus arcularius HHB13444]